VSSRCSFSNPPVIRRFMASYRFYFWA
jgi:hypothetical protein